MLTIFQDQHVGDQASSTWFFGTHWKDTLILTKITRLPSTICFTTIPTAQCRHLREEGLAQTADPQSHIPNNLYYLKSLACYKLIAHHKDNTFQYNKTTFKKKRRERFLIEGTSECPDEHFWFSPVNSVAPVVPKHPVMRNSQGFHSI